jgi:GcrA cell cycle regulator
MSEWSDNELTILRDMWVGQYSSSQIGKEVGKTRNAVIGKAHRLHLPKRKPRQAPTPLLPYVLKKKVLKKEVVRKKTVREPTVRVRSLLPDSDGCRWPVGTDVLHAGFYCNVERINGSSYCLHHHSIAHIPARKSHRAVWRSFAR